MPTYAVRAPLARWLAAEAVTQYERRASRYRLLDVSCGDKPYEPFFAPYVTDYVGVDVVENPRAELLAPIEALPVEDGAFDVVLAIQVLEHVDEPTQAVRELRRATAPGGVVLASTHGVQVYHPSPGDYWRWTHAGLEKLFRAAGEWDSVAVVPGSGTAACVGMLVAVYLDLAARRAHAGALARPLVSGINRATEALDRRSELLASVRPGTLHANFHIVAGVPA